MWRYITSLIQSKKAYIFCAVPLPIRLFFREFRHLVHQTANNLRTVSVTACFPLQSVVSILNQDCYKFVQNGVFPENLTVCVQILFKLYIDNNLTKHYA